MPAPEKSPQSTRKYLTVAEVAERLGVSEKYVRREIADKALPARKFGSAVRIKITDVEAYEDDVSRDNAAYM